MLKLTPAPSVREEIKKWINYKKPGGKKLLVVLSGAGISKESGIATFRDSGGLWEKYDITKVATPEAWQKNPELVLEFYNERRKQLQDVQPNKAHKILKELEQDFEVVIITQNVDNLHERAGSQKILHLHGELTKVRSEKSDDHIYDIGYQEVKIGDLCPTTNTQLRPHVVWFGEAVPMIEPAARIASLADIFVVIGTSLAVYPAAGLLDFVPKNSKIYAIDPADLFLPAGVKHIKDVATKGTEKLKEELLNAKSK